MNIEINYNFFILFVLNLFFLCSFSFFDLILFICLWNFLNNTLFFLLSVISNISSHTYSFHINWSVLLVFRIFYSSFLTSLPWKTILIFFHQPVWNWINKYSFLPFPFDFYPTSLNSLLDFGEAVLTNSYIKTWFLAVISVGLLAMNIYYANFGYHMRQRSNSSNKINYPVQTLHLHMHEQCTSIEETGF